MNKDKEEMIELFKQISHKVGWILALMVISFIMSIMGGCISILNALG